MNTYGYSGAIDGSGAMGQVQSIYSKAVFVFVGDANAHHLESVSATNGHGRDALDFCNLAG